MTNKELAASIAAWVFVLIWSSGFVVARGISGQIDPYLFLFLRLACVLLVFSTLMLAMRLPLPSAREQWHLLGIGALTQGLYLGPGFWAVSQGLEAGIMTLFGALQPALTAVLAWYFFAEQVNSRTIIGLLFGIAGVTVAVLPILMTESLGEGISLPVVSAAIFSNASITCGTVLQKSSIVSVPLLAAISIQTLGALLVMTVINLIWGQWTFTPEPQVLGYLAYAVIVLSIGGFTLLTWLIRSGSATHTSSLLLLVPPLAALMSWCFYGESLSNIQLLGFALALLGVVLTRSSTR